jgi:hypothetical protein
MGLNPGVIIYFSYEYYQLPIEGKMSRATNVFFCQFVSDEVSKLLNFQHNIYTEHFYRTDTNKIKKTFENTAALKIHSQGTSQL